MNHTSGAKPSTRVFIFIDCFIISTKLLELDAMIKLAQTVLVIPQKEFLMMFECKCLYAFR